MTRPRRPRTMQVEDHTFLPRFIDRDSVVVDLGAHLGAFSHAMIRAFGCRCLAVEARPDFYARIPPDPRLETIHAAVVAEPGEVTLNLCSISMGASVGEFRDAAVTGRVTVPGLTLADLLDRLGGDEVALLKMDIEGAELAVLENAPSEVLSQFGQMTVEFHEFRGLMRRRDVRRVRCRLRRLGFAPVKFFEPHNIDLLFINRRRCPVGWGELFFLRGVVGFGLRLPRTLYRRLRRAASGVLRPIVRRR